MSGLRPERIRFIMSCGKRSVYIPKSGLKFPAWEVRLGDGNVVFRTKKDFLRLGRHQISLPKTSLMKLCDESPWIRPEESSEEFESARSGARNNWHVRMSKSLLQIDQFLNLVQDFSRTNPETPLAITWQEFCRPQDSQGIAPIGEPSYRGSKSNAHTRPIVGAKLGQYYSSETNARQLACIFLEKLIAQGGSQKSMTVIEPTCGFGRLILSLLSELADPKYAERQFKFHSVVGIDLDSCAVEKCRSLESQTIPLVWHQGDFLKTKRDHIAPNLSLSVGMIGGPPYGTNRESRDLPMQFVEHAIAEYQPEVICFMMPQRCATYKYDLPTNYRSQNVELSAAAEFYFQGRGNAVLQPSIIQCFWKIG